jgi:hypothetical protein
MVAVKKIEDGRGAEVTISAEDDAMIFANTLLSWLRGKGRQARDAGRMDIYMQVLQLWQQYLMILQGAMAPPAPGQEQSSAMAGGSPEGGSMSAAGGTPNQVAPEPGAGAAGATAGAILGDADQAANAVARQQMPHES